MSRSLSDFPRDVKKKKVQKLDFICFILIIMASIMNKVQMRFKLNHHLLDLRRLYTCTHTEQRQFKGMILKHRQQQFAILLCFHAIERG